MKHRFISLVMELAELLDQMEDEDIGEALAGAGKAMRMQKGSGERGERSRSVRPPSPPEVAQARTMIKGLPLSLELIPEGCRLTHLTEGWWVDIVPGRGRLISSVNAPYFNLRRGWSLTDAVLCARCTVTKGGPEDEYRPGECSTEA